MTQEEIIQALKALPTATLSEATAQPCDLPPLVRCMVPGARVVGTAFTVRCPLGDNTAVTRAVDMAPRGSVMVIDCGGPPRTAMWGETASFTSQVKGIAGCVTNGAARDIDAIVELGFPVFAAGLSLRGSTKGQPGQIGVAVTIGDILIRPGDFICGDSDGVVVIPTGEIDAVLKAAGRLLAEEKGRNERIKAGVPLAEILAKSGNRGQS
ncbi:MAG: RraA family protein [Rhodospirillaceae bacterium]|nr:RraA family protein [Rhodospirillaceae bacterium]